MTIEDVTVIGLGSIALLCLFLFASIVMNRVDVWGVVRRYVVVRLAEGDAGDIRTAANGDAGDAPIVERAQQHQVNDGINIEAASEREALTLRQLPKTELIVLLAIQRKDDGSYLWSSNEIKKFVPGADGPIGEVIATVRGKKEPTPHSTSLKRPANGW